MPDIFDELDRDVASPSVQRTRTRRDVFDETDGDYQRSQSSQDQPIDNGRGFLSDAVVRFDRDMALGGTKAVQGLARGLDLSNDPAMPSATELAATGPLAPVAGPLMYLWKRAKESPEDRKRYNEERERRLSESALYQFGTEMGDAVKEYYDPNPARDNDITSKLISGVASTVPVIGLGAIHPGLAAAQYGLSQGEDMAQEAIEANRPDVADIAYLGGAGVGAVSELLMGAPLWVLRSIKAMRKSGVPPQQAASALQKWAAANPVKTAIGKGAAHEFVQEGSEQVGQNLIASDVAGYAPDRKWSEGAAEAALVGGLSGGLLGGAFTAAARQGMRPPPASSQAAPAASQTASKQPPVNSPVQQAQSPSTDPSDAQTVVNEQTGTTEFPAPKQPKAPIGENWTQEQEDELNRLDRIATFAMMGGRGLSEKESLKRSRLQDKRDAAESTFQSPAGTVSESEKPSELDTARSLTGSYGESSNIKLLAIKPGTKIETDGEGKKRVRVTISYSNGTFGHHPENERWITFKDYAKHKEQLEKNWVDNGPLENKEVIPHDETVNPVNKLQVSKQDVTQEHKSAESNQAEKPKNNKLRNITYNRLSGKAGVAYKVMIRAGFDEETSFAFSVFFAEHFSVRDETSEQFRDNLLKQADAIGLRPPKSTRRFKENPSEYSGEFGEKESYIHSENAKIANDELESQQKEKNLSIIGRLPPVIPTPNTAQPTQNQVGVPPERVGTEEVRPSAEAGTRNQLRGATEEAKPAAEVRKVEQTDKQLKEPSLTLNTPSSQTITGSNVQAGTEMPVPPKAESGVGGVSSSKESITPTGTGVAPSEQSIPTRPGESLPEPTAEKKPVKRKMGRGIPMVKRLHRETELVGDDIISWMFDQMRMMSKSTARKQGKEKWALIAPEYDDSAPLSAPHHNLIYSETGEKPDQVAQAAYRAGKISEPYAPALWAAIHQASKIRSNVLAAEKAQAKLIDEQAKEHEEWIKATKDGAFEVSNEQLGVGDIMDVEGEKVEVTERDEDGTLTLKDGTRFGTQKLADGQSIYVEKLKQAEVEDIGWDVEPDVKPPKLAPGEKGTGDLLKNQTEDFALVGERGTDFDRIAKEKEEEQARKAEAKRIQDEQQADMFAPKNPALPAESSPAVKPEQPAENVVEKPPAPSFASEENEARLKAKLKKWRRGQSGEVGMLGGFAQAYSDAVQLGAIYIVRGYHRFADWMVKMKDDFGDLFTDKQWSSIYETARITIESPGSAFGGSKLPGLQPGIRPPADRIIMARGQHTGQFDESVIPQELVQHLDAHQRQGTAAAIQSLNDRGGFLLADGTGVGKTRQAIATAQYYAKQGLKVIIVTKNETIGKPWKNLKRNQTPVLGGSYGYDSKQMGVPVALVRKDELKGVQPGHIGITTYQYLGSLVPNTDRNTVLIFDEAHALKNDSDQAKFGMRAVDRSKYTMFMSATPADKPLHIYYLARIGIMEGKTEQQALRDLGMQLIKIQVWDSQAGRKVDRWVWREDQRVSEQERNQRFSALFDRMTANGAMLKREISMDGVHVQVLRLAMPPEAHEAMAKELETAARAYHMSASSTIDDFEGLRKALILGNQRRQQEPYKIAPTVLLAQRELSAGRQVVIFVQRVNESESGYNEKVKMLGGETEKIRHVANWSEGTAKLMREALEDAGIHDIAEIHGNSEQGSIDAMADFQSGKKRVVIATIESGGTGINLDDTIGNRPRSMIVVTAPFDAVGNVQAAGRIWRLKTLSGVNLFYLFGDTAVDDWNGSIIGSKMSHMGAVVEGQVRRLDVSNPEWVSTDDYHEKVEPVQGQESPIVADELPQLDWKPFKTKAGKDKFVAPATKKFWDWWDANGKRDNPAGITVGKWQDQWQVWSDRDYRIEDIAESLAEPNSGTADEVLRLMYVLRNNVGASTISASQKPDDGWDVGFHINTVLSRIIQQFSDRAVKAYRKHATERGNLTLSESYSKTEASLVPVFNYTRNVLADLVASIPAMTGNNLATGQREDSISNSRTAFPNGKSGDIDTLLGELLLAVKAAAKAKGSTSKGDIAAAVVDVKNLAELLIAKGVSVSLETLDTLQREYNGKTTEQQERSEAEFWKSVSNPEFNDIFNVGNMRLIRPINPTDDASESRSGQISPSASSGLSISFVESQLEHIGIPVGGISRVSSEPNASWKARIVFKRNTSDVVRIEINAAKINSPSDIQESITHEVAHIVWRQGIVNEVLQTLTENEQSEIRADVEQLNYKEESVNEERGVRGIDLLARKWHDRNWFMQVVGAVLEWASKHGMKLRRLAAERIAARAVAQTMAQVIVQDSVEYEQGDTVVLESKSDSYDIENENLLRASAVERIGGLPPFSDEQGRSRIPIRLAEPDAKTTGTDIDLSMGSPARRELERVLGVRIVFFDAGKTGINGVNNSEIPGYLFINVRANRPYLTIIGHEFLHELKQRSPELYQQALAELEPLMTGFHEYWTALYMTYKANGLSPMAIEDAKENLIADFLGDSLVDPKFWEKLSRGNPTMFERVSNMVSEWISKLTESLKLFGSHRYFSDVQKAQDVLAGAMVAHSQKSGSQLTKTGSGGLRFSITDASSPLAFRNAADVEAIVQNMGNLPPQSVQSAHQMFHAGNIASVGFAQNAFNALPPEVQKEANAVGERLAIANQYAAQVPNVTQAGQSGRLEDMANAIGGTDYEQNRVFLGAFRNMMLLLDDAKVLAKEIADQKVAIGTAQSEEARKQPVVKAQDMVQRIILHRKNALTKQLNAARASGNTALEAYILNQIAWFNNPPLTAMRNVIEAMHQHYGDSIFNDATLNGVFWSNQLASIPATVSLGASPDVVDVVKAGLADTPFPARIPRITSMQTKLANQQAALDFLNNQVIAHPQFQANLALAAKKSGNAELLDEGYRENQWANPLNPAEKRTLEPGFSKAIVEANQDSLRTIIGWYEKALARQDVDPVTRKGWERTLFMLRYHHNTQANELLYGTITPGRFSVTKMLNAILSGKFDIGELAEAFIGGREKVDLVARMQSWSNAHEALEEYHNLHAITVQSLADKAAKDHGMTVAQWNEAIGNPIASQLQRAFGRGGYRVGQNVGQGTSSHTITDADMAAVKAQKEYTDGLYKRFAAIESNPSNAKNRIRIRERIGGSVIERSPVDVTGGTVPERLTATGMLFVQKWQKIGQDEKDKKFTKDQADKQRLELINEYPAEAVVGFVKAYWDSTFRAMMKPDGHRIANDEDYSPMFSAIAHDIDNGLLHIESLEDLAQEIFDRIHTANPASHQSLDTVLTNLRSDFARMMDKYDEDTNRTPPVMDDSKGITTMAADNFLNRPRTQRTLPVGFYDYSAATREAQNGLRGAYYEIYSQRLVLAITETLAAVEKAIAEFYKQIAAGATRKDIRENQRKGLNILNYEQALLAKVLLERLRDRTLEVSNRNKVEDTVSLQMLRNSQGFISSSLVTGVRSLLNNFIGPITRQLQIDSEWRNALAGNVLTGSFARIPVHIYRHAAESVRRVMAIIGSIPRFKSLHDHLVKNPSLRNNMAAVLTGVAMRQVARYEQMNATGTVAKDPFLQNVRGALEFFTQGGQQTGRPLSLWQKTGMSYASLMKLMSELVAMSALQRQVDFVNNATARAATEELVQLIQARAMKSFATVSGMNIDPLTYTLSPEELFSGSMLVSADSRHKELHALRSMFLRSGINLDEKVATYWQKIQQAQRTGQPTNGIQLLDSAEMAALELTMAKHINKASQSNRPQHATQFDQMVFTLRGFAAWENSVLMQMFSTHSKDTFKTMAPRDAALFMQVCLAIMLMGMFINFPLRKFLTEVVMGEELPIRNLKDARNMKDAVMSALQMTSMMIPIVAQIPATIIGAAKPGLVSHMGGFAPVIFSIGETLASGANKLISGGDKMQVFIETLGRIVSNTRIITNRMGYMEGSVTERNAKNAMRANAPMGVEVRGGTGGVGPQKYSPAVGNVNRVQNALSQPGGPDMAAVEVYRRAGIADLVKAGMTPEGAAKSFDRSVIASSPDRAVFGSELTADQRAEMLGRMNADQLEAVRRVETGRVAYARSYGMPEPDFVAEKRVPGGAGGLRQQTASTGASIAPSLTPAAVVGGGMAPSIGTVGERPSRAISGGYVGSRLRGGLRAPRTRIASLRGNRLRGGSTRLRSTYARANTPSRIFSRNRLRRLTLA